MMSLFGKRGVGVKIGLGYAMVALVLVGAVSTTIWQVRRTAAVTNRVVDLRVPTAQASLGMLNGINHSLAALRGWIILGKDKFKVERAKAWSEEIEPALTTMKTFAVNWTDPKNIERLETIESKLVGEAMQSAEGNKSEAARMLGIKTSALYYKLEKYGLAEEE